MRENCQSGSMSGDRKQNQAKPDCGDEAKAESTIHREITVSACSRLYRPSHSKSPGQGVLSKTMVMMSAQLQRHSNVERPSPVPDEDCSGATELVQTSRQTEDCATSLAALSAGAILRSPVKITVATLDQR